MRLKAKTKDVFILSVFVVGHIGSAYHRVRITASPPVIVLERRIDQLVRTSLSN